MNNDFPRIITFLRKERGLSQKQAAADLEISQALLSHYEKGIRECGLDFLIKVAEYYDVTTDYLLGRTLQRNNTSAPVSENAEESNSGKISGSMVNQINRKVISNSCSVVYDLLAQIGYKKTDQLARYRDEQRVGERQAGESSVAVGNSSVVPVFRSEDGEVKPGSILPVFPEGAEEQVKEGNVTFRKRTPRN